VTERLRRLPIPLPPAANEVLTSYIGRLAAMHGLPDVELWNHFGVPDRPGRRKRITLDRLAAATGYPPGNLARALPELRDPAPEWPALRHLPQRTCPRCTARHRGGPVRRLFAHHQYLCLRHGYWLGVPDPGRDPTPDRLATGYPELVTVQRRHQWAVARYGWPATFSAVIAATGICVDLRFSAADHPLWHRWEKRLDRLIPPSREYDTYTRSRFFAVIYPEVVALATVIASPTWWSTATDADSDELQRFLDTACQAVATPSTWPAHDSTHPAVRWAQTPTISRVPVQPAATFPEIGRLYHPRSGMVAQERLAEQKTARRFAADRRAPRTSRTPFPYAYRRPHPPDGEHADRESAPPRHIPRLAAALPAQPAARR